MLTHKSQVGVWTKHKDKDHIQCGHWVSTEADWNLRLFCEVTAVLKQIRGWRSQGRCLHSKGEPSNDLPGSWSVHTFSLSLLYWNYFFFLVLLFHLTYLLLHHFLLHTMLCSVFSQASCYLPSIEHLTHLWTLCIEQCLGHSRCSTNITSRSPLPVLCQGLPVVSQAWMWVTIIMSHQLLCRRGWEVIVTCLPKFSED